MGFGETEHVKMGCIFMDVLIQILLTTEVDFALDAMFPVGLDVRSIPMNCSNSQECTPGSLP